MDDTIRRLQAFAEAGADVLFAPGLKTKEEILTVVKAVAPKPVNVVMGLNNAAFSLRELEDLGVKRSKLKVMAQEAAKQWTAGFNPRPVSARDFEDLYSASFRSRGNGDGHRA